MNFYVQALLICCIIVLMPEGLESQDLNPVWTDWSTWSICDRTCGGGSSFRVRECINQSGIDDCEQSETQSCNTQNCEEISSTTSESLAWGPWTEWTTCSVSCGGGTSFRVRECNILNGGPSCEDSQSKICNTLRCFDDTTTAMTETPTEITVTATQLGTWSMWSACDKLCGGGARFRTRSCVILPSGLDCSQKQEETCNIDPCEASTPEPETMPGSPAVTPQPTGAPETRPMPTPEGTPEPMSTAEHTFLPELETTPEPTVTSEPRVTPEPTATREEATSASPEMLSTIPSVSESSTVEEFSQWGEWSLCDKQCNGGLRYRTRACVIIKSESECEQLEQSICNTEPCTSPEPKPEEMPSSPMPETSATNSMMLSQTTGIFEPDRTSIDLLPEPETTKPVAPESEITSSGLMPEPETTAAMAKYTEWAQWTKCDKQCGGGLRYRTRQCVIMTSESECEQAEESACNTDACTVPTPTPEGQPEPTPTPEGEPDGPDPEQYSTPEWRPEPESMSTKTSTTTPGGIKWPEWGGWSVCTEPCGGGLTFRYRECYGWKGDCMESDMISCNTRPCSPKLTMTTIKKPRVKSCKKRKLLAEVGNHKALSFNSKHTIACVWTILAPKDHRIKIVVEELKMGSNNDVLEIYEGPSNVKKGNLGVIIARLTKEIDGKTSFYSVTRRMSVQMQTTNNNGRSSFKLRYIAIKDSDMMENGDQDFDKHSSVELWWKLLRYLREFMSQLTTPKQ